MIDNAQYIISEHILNQETQQAIEFIRNGKLNIMQLFDDKKQTVLYQAVLVDNIELTLFLVEYATQHYSQAEVAKWVNKFNIDLFAPLHQASYNGCFECANILLGVQANSNLNSGYGLLPIHAAAQGDSPCMIRYWLDKGFDVDVPDSDGNTCLHWAVYNNCEQTVNYLIAWGAKLDQLNNKKQTALHLAVVSMASKIIRKLLIRNADRNIKDSLGKLPLDYAIENEYYNIARMIEDPINITVICNLKQPYHRVDRNHRSVIIFLVIFISSNAMILNNDFVQDNQFIFILQSSIALITLLLFVWISYSDAGVLNQQIDLNSAFFECKYDASKLCPDCQLIKPPRSKHCEICKKCVMVYDHHCPWVNNCIGAKNFKVFYLFISTLITDEVLGLALIITSIITRDFTLLNIITYGYPCAIIGFFLVPTLLLLFYQTKNIFQGITTYERITNSQQTLQKSALIPEEQSVSGSMIMEPLLDEPEYNTRSPIQNCMDMCYRNQITYNQNYNIQQP